MIVSLTLLADIVPADVRGVYLAPLSSMYSIASVVGPILGGFITDGPGWRFCFWINVPIGAVCAVIIWFYVPQTIGRAHLFVKRDIASAALDPAAIVCSSEAVPLAPAAPDSPTAPSAPPRHDDAHEELDVGTVDYAGIVLCVASSTCLCLAVTWGGITYAWGSATIIALLCVAAVCCAGFVYVEGWVAQDPVVPLRLFLVRNFTVCVVLGALTGWAMFGGCVRR